MPHGVPEAPTGSSPTTAHHKRVLLGDLLERRVLGVNGWPLDLVLVDVEYHHLVDLHVCMLQKPRRVSKDGTQVLRHLKCRSDAPAQRRLELCWDVVGDVIPNLGLHNCANAIPWPLALARAAIVEPDPESESIK